MEIRTFPNSSRPGVGLKPRSESARPLLPQHARHCPVLEAGSGLGYLVYPPLEPNEAYQVGYEGDGRYSFSYYLSGPAGWQSLYTVTVSMPMGSVGMLREDVKFSVPDPPVTEEAARRMMRAFVVPEDMGTPPGGITMRGATNFQTPPGWDTVYLPVLNVIDRPVAPMLVVRVETDWYAHESEFRYVFQPGEGMSGTHNLPIGQVLFVPREKHTLKECNAEELALIKESKENFSREKSAHRLTTRYGLQYSPHYAQRSRAVSQAAAEAAKRGATAPATPSEGGGDPPEG